MSRVGRFAGKVIIVTGGASGIGRAAALRFGQEGGLVCIADLSAEGADAVATAIGAAGGRAMACTTDVSQPEDNARMVAETQRQFGRVDVAFLNAGMLGRMDGFETAEVAWFDKLLSVNLRGCFLGLKALLPAIGHGGAVVVTASTAGFMGLPESPGYSASKHGVLGLVKSASPSFAARGARVNAICPGYVATPMMGAADPPLVDPADLVPVPHAAPGTAQHVAELALYLAEPASRFLNGTAIVCDAGASAVLRAP